MTIAVPDDTSPGPKVAQNPNAEAGMHVCGKCAARWGGLTTAHCSACHRTFTTVANFDRHRAGSHAPGIRHCLDPATVGFVDAGREYPCWGRPGRTEVGCDVSTTRRPSTEQNARDRLSDPDLVADDGQIGAGDPAYRADEVGGVVNITNLTECQMPREHDDLYRRWWDMGGRCERNRLPAILWDLYENGAFTIGTQGGYPIFDTHLLAIAVEQAWSSAEYPAGGLEEYQWQDLFHTADEYLAYPDAPVTLYRGVREEVAAQGMSWTGSLDTARGFADRFNATTGGGLVYRLVDVEPEHVLAQITNGRPEDEYVLEPEYLAEVSDNGLLVVFENRRVAS
jgi:hypothetical protein